MRNVFFAAAMAGLVLCMGSVWAGQRADSSRADTAVGGHAGHHDGKQMMADLNLTADQKAKLKTLREEMKPVREKQMEAMKGLRIKMRDELLKSKSDSRILADLAKLAGEAHATMVLKEQEHLIKVKAVLSADQFSKVLSREFVEHPMRGPGGPHMEKGPKGQPGEKGEE
jgi:Spy/CpxP family protein refolding chaperone